MDNKITYKTEEEMQKELQERIKSRKSGSGKDGYIIYGESNFTYREIVYLVRVLRYYNHTDKFTKISRDRISDCHAVVEHPDETKPIIELIPYDYSCEFLFHDTLHSYNDNQTIEEQVEECHRLAKQDIDNLLDGEISKRIDEGIKALQNVKDKLEQGVKKLK